MDATYARKFIQNNLNRKFATCWLHYGGSSWLRYVYGISRGLLVLFGVINEIFFNKSVSFD